MSRKLPLPASSDTPLDRFHRFAKDELGAPNAGIIPFEEAIAILEAEERRIDGRIAELRRELEKLRREQDGRSIFDRLVFFGPLE